MGGKGRRFKCLNGEKINYFFSFTVNSIFIMTSIDDLQVVDDLEINMQITSVTQHFNTTKALTRSTQKHVRLAISFHYFLKLFIQQ